VSNNKPSWQSRFYAYSMSMAELVRSYIAKKKMSTDDLAKKINISKTKSKHMLSGSYDFSIEEIAKLELLFLGHYDTYEKILLIEKISKQEDSSL